MRKAKRGRPAKVKIAVNDTPKKRGRPKKQEEKPMTDEDLIAAICGPRAIRWTSSPDKASLAPRYPPIAPAPYTANFISYLLALLDITSATILL